MQFFNTRPEVQQRIAVLVPVIALALSLFVVYPGWQHYQELKGQVVSKHAELETLKSVPLPEPDEVVPTANAAPSEPPQFMGQLSEIALSSGCHVVGFDITQAVAPKPDDGKPEGTIRPVRAMINLAARYPQIRAFLSRLSQAPRLYVVTDVTIKAKPAAAPQNVASLPGIQNPASVGTLEAAIEIERYVLPQEKK